MSKRDLGVTNIPTLPLRDIVVFPDMVFPLFVGREKSINALELSKAAGKKIFLISQKNPAKDIVELSDLYNIGVLATVIQMLKLPDGTFKLLVETKQRAALEEFFNEGDSFLSNIELVNENFIEHKLTHLQIQSRFWKISDAPKIKVGIYVDDFENFPMSRLMHKFFEKYNSKLSLISL